MMGDDEGSQRGLPAAAKGGGAHIKAGFFIHSGARAVPCPDLGLGAGRCSEALRCQTHGPPEPERDSFPAIMFALGPRCQWLPGVTMAGGFALWTMDTSNRPPPYCQVVSGRAFKAGKTEPVGSDGHATAVHP